jgi:hypothetical protein
MINFCDKRDETNIKLNSRFGRIRRGVSKKTVHVTIGSRITKIDEEAFSCCKELKSIHLPDTIDTIGEKAFQHCISLKSISIPNKVRSLESTFVGCNDLASVNLPNSMKDISNAFLGCRKLKYITIPNNVTNMHSAFNNCHSLISITIPNEVQNIERAFQRCASLKKAYISNSVTNMKYAFCECTSLTDINIPSSVLHLECAFQYCTSLKEIKLPDSISDIDYTFFGCASLSSVILPESIKHMEGSFVGCKSLKTIIIPSTVNSIRRAFKGCSSLRTITIPKEIRSMQAAFIGCTSLISISITILPNETLQNVQASFQDCRALTCVALPTNLQMNSRQACSNCTALDKREIDGINNHEEAEQFLFQRFDNLPIHRECYDTEVTPLSLSKCISNNKNVLSSVDAMNMTPLHVLCCNPSVNAIMIQLLKDMNPHTGKMRNVMGKTPLMLFLECRCNSINTSGGEEQQLKGLHDIIKLGLTSNDIECILSLMIDENEKHTFLLELEKRNEAGMLPFMAAATLSQCTLESIYMLAMRRPDLLQQKIDTN